MASIGHTDVHLAQIRLLLNPVEHGLYSLVIRDIALQNIVLNEREHKENTKSHHTKLSLPGKE